MERGLSDQTCTLIKKQLSSMSSENSESEDSDTKL